MRPGPTIPLAASHALWLGLFLLMPLGIMAWLSLLTPAGVNDYAPGVSLANYARMVGAPYPSIIVVSLGYAAATTLICLVLAFPVALAVATAPVHWRNPLLLAVCLPFWVSTLVRMYALQQILGRKGLINESLGWLWDKAAMAVPSLPAFDPLPLLHSPTGVLAGLVYAFLPFGILPVYAAVARLDGNLLEASHDLGASAWQTTVRVIIPLAMPGIVAAMILIFVPALGAFYVSEMLGGPNDLLIGNIIEYQFKDANNWPFGAALSIGLLALAFVAFALAFGWRRLPGKSHG